MSIRPADERIADFDEVDLGITADEAVAEAERCIQCKKPKCIAGCPVGIDIPAFVAHVASGCFNEAADVLFEDNLLPAICGRVCPQESQCEGVCVVGRKERPVAIGALERFVADWDRARCDRRVQTTPSTGKKVAVVGSGPAGLAASGELARAGHAVTLYESLHAPGGVLMYGIPSFRLPKDVVKAEVDALLSLGVELRTNHLVGRSISTDELMEYDAIFIATGAGLPHFLGIPGENLPGVYSANEFLTRVNLMHAERFPDFDTPIRRGCRVVVAGGGNVAMDAARVARRLGAEVALIYRRREEDLPARKAEIARALEEGIRFVCCAEPVRVLGDQKVAGIECLRVAMGDLDESGRPRPETVTGTEFVVETDVFIVAIGQGPNPLLIQQLPRLARGRKGNVIADEDGRTSIPRVFAAGDVATGAATVILAMGAAKRAAAAIDALLKE